MRRKKIELLISSFADFQGFVRGYESEMIFRGVRSAEYDLTPSVGRYWSSPLRENWSADKFFQEERECIARFKREAVAFMPGSRSEWEWLALAQQHGLPTRLLDWTWNALVALYFAVEPVRISDPEERAEAAVYVAPASSFSWLTEKEIAHGDPLSSEGVVAFTPARHFHRLAAQGAVLTCAGDPREPMSEKHMHRLIIPASAKRDLRHVLFDFNVNPATIYPGLDGIGSHQRLWTFERTRWGLGTT